MKKRKTKNNTKKRWVIVKAFHRRGGKVRSYERKGTSVKRHRRYLSRKNKPKYHDIKKYTQKQKSRKK